jgi:hypothetical protein
MEPAAWATPSVSRTLVSSDSGSVTAPEAESETTSSPLITALVLAEPVVKISSNAFEIVSVRT